MRLPLPYLLAISLLAALLPATGHTQLQSLQKQGTTRAVVVGISEYQDKSIGDLRFAHRDAEAFAGYLQSEVGGGLSEEHFRLLTNEKATLGQISAALDWLQEASQSEDRAIIYFSGHGDAVKGGTQEGYMLCHDALVRRYTMSGALSLIALQNVITTLSIEKETQVLFLADACRSGGIEDRMGVRGFGQDLARQYSNELKLLSCQPHELSHEGEQWGGGRGVFSYYLIEGLMGFADEDGDEVITLMELEQYVKRKVSMDMRPVSQIPIARGEQTKPVAFVNSRHLADLKQQKSRELPAFKPAAPRANISYKILADADSNAQQYYHAFMQAIERKDFLAPEEDCAEKWFTLLIDNPAISSIHAELHRTYAAALQDDAQQVLNKYLVMDAEELSRADHLSLQKYRKYPKYLGRANEIIGVLDFRYRLLKSRELLFDGIVEYLALGSSYSDQFTIPIRNKWHSSLELEPNNIVANFYLLELHARKRQDRDSAEHFFNMAVQLDETWALPYAHWGFYLAKDFRDIEQAELVLKKGIAIDSTDIYMLKSMASYYFFQQQYNESLPYFFKALEHDSSDHIAWLNIGVCYQKLGDVESAINAYQLSLEIKPDQHHGYSFLGYLYYMAGDYQRAKETYLAALHRQERDINLRGRLALVYLDELNKVEFEKQCEAIHQIEPNDYLPWYLRSCYAAKENNDAIALQHLEKALVIDAKVSKIIRCQSLVDKVKNDTRYQNLILEYGTTRNH